VTKPLSPFGQSLLNHTLATGTITLDEQEYPYRICRPSLAPELKYFIGFGAHTGGSAEVFFSDDWPKDIRKYVMLHEVRCVPHVASTPGHCRQTEESILRAMPESKRRRFVVYRKAAFTELAKYLGVQTNTPAVTLANVTETLEYLRTL
jgi:hypothetical protein